LQQVVALFQLLPQLQIAIQQPLACLFFALDRV
jgi:hypothetical protein